MKQLSLQQIQDAHKRILPVLNQSKPTPLWFSKRLSEKYGFEVWIKREELTPVRSYKIRGAFNMISQLPPAKKKKGVVCASAGNHAQGVALACKDLGIKGVIFMPRTTPEQKVYKTKQFGGDNVEIILVGDTFDEAFEAAKRFEGENKMTFVHPFDDEKVIEGQATVGLEIFQKVKGDIDYIIAPIGGGGLISGVIQAKNALNKKTKIIGVEPEGAPSMSYALNNGGPERIKMDSTFIDGASVARVGDITHQICKQEGISVITCPEGRVCSTILELHNEDGIIAEPAGALAIDSLKELSKTTLKHLVGTKKKVVVILSGGNAGEERLAEVKERSLKYEGKKKYFIVNLPQRPGALKELLSCLGEEDDIARFEYLKKTNKEKAPILIGIETSKKQNFNTIEKLMEEKGYTYRDITHDDLFFELVI